MKFKAVDARNFLIFTGLGANEVNTNFETDEKHLQRITYYFEYRLIGIRVGILKNCNE